MSAPFNVALIGYRGSGKTTVGRLLAERLRWRFVDTDEEIVRDAGRSIADIFATEGEKGFRDREQRALERCLAQKNHVVSVGGGAVESPANQERLRKSSVVYLLDAPAESLWERIQADPSTEENRPDLAGGGLAEVQDMLARRAPLYSACAHVVIAVQDRSPGQIAAEIETHLRRA